MWKQQGSPKLCGKTSQNLKAQKEKSTVKTMDFPLKLFKSTQLCFWSEPGWLNEKLISRKESDGKSRIPQNSTKEKAIEFSQICEELPQTHKKL